MGTPTIVSFHAHKGGCGRSFVLANVAWALACSGKQVLMLDLDLDAPSLHRYFAPFLVDPSLSSTRGILDAALAFTATPSTPDLGRYAISIDWPQLSPGGLELIGAGAQNEGYAARAAAFDWKPHAEASSEGGLVNALQKMFGEYDVVLIDARSGLNEVSRLALKLSTAIVMCLAPSRLDAAAASELTKNLLVGRSGPPLTAIPLVLKTDRAEKTLFDEAQKAVRGAFADTGGSTRIALTHPPSNVEFPYVPYFSYNSILAPFGEGFLASESLTRASTRLATLLVDEPIQPIFPSPADRSLILQRYGSGTS